MTSIGLSSRRARRCALAACTVLALVPAAAPAATVSSTAVIDLSESTDVAVTQITFVGAPGEANGVVPRYVPSGVAFKAVDGPLEAGANCTRTAPDEVTCPLLPGTVDLDTTMDLRDGNDRATLLLTDPPQQREGASRAFRVLAGDGNDIVVADNTARDSVWIDGGPGRDRVIGGGGRDTVAGGSDADEVFGGSGNDVVVGDRLLPVTLPGSTPADTPPDLGPDRDDAIEGGDGRDTVSYAGREAGVTVDLVAKTGGTPHVEADRLSLIESASGTEADDILRGDSGANVLDGQEGGRDTVEGRGGNDRLLGEDGVFRGGPGNDFITPLNGRAVCGSGSRDYLNAFGVYSTGRKPRAIPADCETTTLFNGVIDVPILVAGRYAILHITARDRRLDAGSLTLLRNGRVLGRIARLDTRKTTSRGRDQRMRLTAAGRRTVAGGRAPAVQLRYAFRSGGHFTITTKLQRGGGGCVILTRYGC